MPLLLAFLKLLGKGAMEGAKLAGKGAVGLGKAAVAGAKAGAKGIGALAKAGFKQTQAGKLANAFAGMGGKGGNTATELKGTAFDPEKYGIENISQGQGILPAEQGLFQEQSNVLNPLRNIYVPGPQGSVIGGQGEAMPGYGMQSPQARIPPAYLQMAQAGQQLQQPQQPISRGSFLGGLKEGFLGMPQTGESTPYYAGKLIPDIIRARLGVSTTGEEARQQASLEAIGGKKLTPEYQSELQSAMDTMKSEGGKLTEEEKIFMYQKLAAKYPTRSAELKRIFFPQSTDNMDFINAMISSGFNR